MTSKHLLLIDDEPTIQEVVQVGLELDTDWIISLASSGSEGVSKAEHEQPDAILLDVMMPGMDGIETFERLKKHKFLHSTPVIFLTAKAQSLQRRQLSQIGARGIISKPFNSLQLAGQISKLLGWQLKS